MKKNNKILIIVIAALVVICLILFFVFIRKGGNGNSSNNSNAEKINLKDGSFDKTNYTVRLNGKEYKITFNYYIVTERDGESEEDLQELKYKIKINDKEVKNIDKYVYYEACEYDVNDKEVCSIEAIKDYFVDYDEAITVMKDSNNKEYLLLDLFGGTPSDSTQLFVINDSGKLIADVFIKEELGFGKFTGNGSDKYKDEEDVVSGYYIKDNKIYYFDAADSDKDPEDGSIDETKPLKLYESVLTIDNDKATVKKTGNTFVGDDFEGGGAPGVNVKTY